MLIEKLIKRKDEYMISGIGGKGEFFFSFWSPPSSFLSFFLFDRKLESLFPTK
jgi:hypothetical protein